MAENNRHRIIGALDTGNLDEALSTVQAMSPFCGAFKIGHGLTMPHGLSVVDQLQAVGADRIFLDLKFHDIPNSVAIAVREAARHGVWMMTLHLGGGRAMVTAAVEEARAFGLESRPLLVGVSVLTSLDDRDLKDDLGVSRSLPEHMLALSRMGMECGLDGVVCSVHEAAAIRAALPGAILVTPGIRPHAGEAHDQERIGDGSDAIKAGADYLVVGRALIGAKDPAVALAGLRLQ